MLTRLLTRYARISSDGYGTRDLLPGGRSGPVSQTWTASGARRLNAGVGLHLLNGWIEMPSKYVVVSGVLFGVIAVLGVTPCAARVRKSAHGAGVDSGNRSDHGERFGGLRW